ncbi:MULTISPECIES: sensor domain-containing diguanylate cyclase [Ramlibacter]|nr:MULTISPECIES: 7TM diverse intracellular signaling domain-containing protein [Ramlibacter]MBA2962987.1 diguanylate cyclase [Ramlibacter sp. CGMCC 1.13660]
MAEEQPGLRARAAALLRRLALLLLLLAGAGGQPAWAVPGEGDITVQGRYAFDPGGQASVEAVAGGALPLQRLDRHRAFALGTGALWMRFELPVLDPAQRWYLLLSGSPFIDRASLFTADAGGRWREQRAGDHLPVAQWAHPHDSPLFSVPAGSGGTVWLRLQNQPAPASPFLRLVSEDGVQAQRQWTHLLVGGYLGFGLLVFVVGLMHARLYRDRAFHAYCAYVACMLLFQLAFTGLGGLFLWRTSAAFNDAAPALFMLPMIAAGIWFVREATALQRHHRGVDRATCAFVLFGLVLAGVYPWARGHGAYPLLNAYGLVSVVLSITLCAWTWRRGERYSGWLLLGFLPVHLAYPFPALRAAGLLPDSWATEYAVLIGSALEIPLLLWILHCRAKDFSETRVRLRALDSTDPLTGLAIPPVLQLRLRDALRRAHATGQRCAVLLVEVANHADIVARAGREAGDRALVVAASRLTAVVRELDTVCRIADHRFAILTEGSQPSERRRLLAQHVVARGLEPVPRLPRDLSLRLRVVTASAPDGSIELTGDGTADEQHLMQRLNRRLDRMLLDPRLVVHHLEPRDAAASVRQPVAAG